MEFHGVSWYSMGIYNGIQWEFHGIYLDLGFPKSWRQPKSSRPETYGDLEITLKTPQYGKMMQDTWDLSDLSNENTAFRCFQMLSDDSFII